MTVNWLTSQLIQHLSDEEKWWKSPLGFDYLASNSVDADEFRGAAAPPAGFERLPMHEEG